MAWWLRGTLFSGTLVILIFFLKIICPIEVGCLVDPFLAPIFSPLFLIEIFTNVPAREILGGLEPLYVLGFWLLVGGLLGFLLENTFGKKAGEQS